VSTSTTFCAVPAGSLDVAGREPAVPHTAPRVPADPVPETDPESYLRELIRRLAAEGLGRPDVDHAVIRENVRLGRPVDDPASLVVEVLGRFVPPVRTQAEIGRERQGWQPPASWRATPKGESSGLTTEEVRHIKRGRRLAGWLREYADQLAPVLAELLREPNVALIRETMASELPAALDVLRPLPPRKGR
jgi:hypothetical protein